MIIVLCFFTVVILLLLDKVDRSVLAIIGAIICYLVLTFFEQGTFEMYVGYIFGTNEDNYVNFHSLILIFGMSIIVNICNRAGFFQYFAFKLVLSVSKRSNLLLLIMCTITLILSALLNNILTVIIIIPLTITISRILNIDPEPYIISQAIVVNIGGTIFSISSIPNILISSYFGMTFAEFFLNVGLFSIFTFFIVVSFFYLLFEKKLKIPKGQFTILKEFNPKNFVANRSLLIKSVLTLLGVIFAFLLIPNTFFPSDMIALIACVVLILISKLDMKNLIEQVDTSMFLYLFGIFFIAGALEETGLLQSVGILLKNFSKGIPLVSSLLVLWISAILSSSIDNIPITKVLIPTVEVLTNSLSPIEKTLVGSSLAYGSNWGDNLTPMGDNILVMNLANKHKHPIRMKEFWRVGFLSTIIQLITVSIYVIFRYIWWVGLILFVVFIIIYGFIIIKHFKGKRTTIIVEVKEK